MGQVPPGPSPRPQQRLWGSHVVLLWFGTPHFAQAVGLTGGWEQGGGSVPAGSPPQLITAVPPHAQGQVGAVPALGARAECGCCSQRGAAVRPGRTRGSQG